MGPNPKVKALLLGISVTLGLSVFIRFGYPFVPVPMLIGIALTAKLGKSAHWRVGLLNGVVIGTVGSLFRFAIQPNVTYTPFELTGALLFTVALYGAVGIGITKLLASGGSIIW